MKKQKGIFKEIIMKAIASNGVEIQTGDAVLVRDGKNTTWSYCHFSHKKDDDSYFPYCTSFTDSMYCIPYEGNEDLTGTTNDFIVPKSVIYAEKQKQWIKKHNIKIGDKVKIIKKANSQEGGWRNYWNNNNMNNTVGKCGKIIEISDAKTINTGILICIDNDNYWYPYHVLEKVKNKNKNKFRFGAKVKAELDFMTITGILIGYCKYDNKYHIATNGDDKNYIGNTYWCSKIEYLD